MILILDWHRSIADLVRHITRILALQVFLVWGAVYLPIVVFTLALSLISYRVERKFSLTEASIGRWLRDFMKASGVIFVFLFIVLESAFIAYAVSPQLWWLWAAGVIGASYGAMMYFAPTVILPIFFKSAPLYDAALLQKITQLCALAGLEAHTVEVLEIGKRTHKANALVVGWGRAKRVYLTDTLIKNLSNAEIEAVLAHELGHSARHDVAKRVLLQVSGFALSLLFMSWICKLHQPPKLDLTDAASVPAAYLCWLTLNAYVSVLLVRVWRAQERAADRFAWKLTGDVEPFISAMQKLMEGNLIGYEKNDSWRYSHPAIPERIQAAREYAATRVVSVTTIRRRPHQRSADAIR